MIVLFNSNCLWHIYMYIRICLYCQRNWSCSILRWWDIHSFFGNLSCVFLKNFWEYFSFYNFNFIWKAKQNHVILVIHFKCFYVFWIFSTVRGNINIYHKVALWIIIRFVNTWATQQVTQGKQKLLKQQASEITTGFRWGSCSSVLCFICCVLYTVVRLLLFFLAMALSGYLKCSFCPIRRDD